ncbi:N-acetylglucosaminidase [Romboutsia sp. 1001713B170207_170306_H8]|uniref:N-acetylglucosaminidase n=1 Tax=Romboutsia sp. 1001713B170207_170306_H8 TaxID=2787112 RepID=UPI00189A3FA0|nr:Ig-like domain-containing protein [Romboutsia sp. 1001713B170207_170306_H8]
MNIKVTSKIITAIYVANLIATDYSFALENNADMTTDETSIVNQSVVKSSNIMCIDTQSSVVNNEDVEVKGWSLNTSGVLQVKVYVDGRYHGNANIGGSRADVNAVYPGYPGGENSGYSYTIDKNTISKGEHIIKVESIGVDGSVDYREISIYMEKPENLMCIDTQSSVVNNENIEVRGWSLNISGVSQVKIYVDGKYYADANTGISRLDVNEVYPGYPGGENSGYSYILDKDRLTKGEHIIKVESIGNDGSIDYREISIYMEKPENRMCIDTQSSVINNENIEVRGWSLNTSGVSQVKIYVDGNYYANANIGGSRPDVDAAYPGYPGGKNSGYSYIIDKNTLTKGNHIIKVESIGTDGSVDSREISINLEKPDPITCIDSPNGNYIVNNNDLTLRGWAVNASGVNHIKVYVDGEYCGNANIGGSRLDVNSIYPQYPNSANSGFSYSIDYKKLSSGSHTIKVEVYGNDGSVSVATTQLNELKVIESNILDFTFDKHVQKQIEKGSNKIWSTNSSGNSVYVNATDEEVRWYMDYNSFKDSNKDMFQFLKINTFRNLKSAKELNDFLDTVLKNPNTNSLSGQGEAFINAAQKYNIDPLYLVAHALWETGYGSSTLSKGVTLTTDHKGNVLETPVTVYNFFGIAAVDNNVISGGASKAYQEGWTTPQKAIEGGAKWISENYIHRAKFNQNTLYKMRWYYDTTNGNWHQYATDINWSRGIAGLMYRMSSIYDINSVQMTYEVPNYSQNYFVKTINKILQIIGGE